MVFMEASAKTAANVEEVKIFANCGAFRMYAAENSSIVLRPFMLLPRFPLILTATSLNAFASYKPFCMPQTFVDFRHSSKPLKKFIAKFKKANSTLTMKYTRALCVSCLLKCALISGKRHQTRPTACAKLTELSGRSTGAWRRKQLLLSTRAQASGRRATHQHTQRALSLSSC